MPCVPAPSCSLRCSLSFDSSAAMTRLHSSGKSPTSCWTVLFPSPPPHPDVTSCLLAPPTGWLQRDLAPTSKAAAAYVSPILTGSVPGALQALTGSSSSIPLLCRTAAGGRARCCSAPCTPARSSLPRPTTTSPAHRSRLVQSRQR